MKAGKDPAPGGKRTPLPRRPPTWAAVPAPWGPDLPAPRPYGPAQRSVCLSVSPVGSLSPEDPAYCPPTAHLLCASPGHSCSLVRDARNSTGRVVTCPPPFCLLGPGLPGAGGRGGGAALLPPGPRACLVQGTGVGVLPSLPPGPRACLVQGTGGGAALLPSWARAPPGQERRAPSSLSRFLPLSPTSPALPTQPSLTQLHAALACPLLGSPKRRSRHPSLLRTPGRLRTDESHFKANPPNTPAPRASNADRVSITSPSSLSLPSPSSSRNLPGPPPPGAPPLRLPQHHPSAWDTLPRAPALPTVPLALWRQPDPRPADTGARPCPRPCVSRVPGGGSPG